MSRVRYSPRAWRLFSVVFRPRMGLSVGRVRLAGVPPSLPPDLPILLVANHVSWWDGFIFREVQEAIRPGGAFFVPMLAQELGKRPFLRLLGGLELEPGSPTSLRRLVRDLEEARTAFPGMTLLFFPQGRIWPSHRRPLGFAPGIRLIARALAPAVVVPAGLHLEPGKEPASGAFVSLAPPLRAGPRDVDPAALETSVEEELDRVLGFLSTYGEDAEFNWPESGDRLPGVFPSQRIST